MKRVVRLCAVLMLSLIAAPALASSAFSGNRLVNPSFESGDSAPTGWHTFGLGTGRWEYGGADGDRCLAAVGDGNITNGWYATSWAPVEGNHVYGATFRVRAQTAGEAGWVFAGLNQVRRYSVAGEQWAPQSFHFRTPDHKTGLRFEVGESRLKGTACFDDVALFPSLPIHRSRGGGRYVLGDGERIMDWGYTADFRPEPSHLNNRRFLLRFLGEFQQDRWVLHSLDVVYFTHEVEVFGQPTLPPGLGISAQARADLKGNFSESDPEALRFITQEAARVEVEVARCDGTLWVHAAGSLRGPWRLMGEVRGPGTFKYTLPQNFFPGRHVYVRLTPIEATRVEITGYRYASRLLYDRKEEPVYGATHYVDVLHESPELQARVFDIGELAPKGRNQVKLEFTYTGPRRRLVVAVMVKKGDQVPYLKETSFPVAGDTKTLRSFPYEIEGPGLHALSVVVRDEKTSELLLDLRSDFDAPERAASE